MQVSRREQRRRADRHGYFMLAGCSLAVTGLVGLLIASQAVARDPVTGCPLKAGLGERITIIVDRTEPWNENQKSLLHAGIKSMASSTKIDDRLTLIAFDGLAERPPMAIFDRCNLGDGASASVVTQTPVLVEQAYQERYALPLEKSLSMITKSSQAPQTHLVAFLSNVAAHQSYESKGSNSRIVLYSDLAENSETFSFYGKPRAQFGEQQFVQHFNALTRDRLRNITLEIFALPTGKPDLARRAKAAWSHALSSNGLSFTLKDF